ncbi:MAG: hypothetical protein WDA22_10800 [Bacteroidota bacterium]
MTRWRVEVDETIHQSTVYIIEAKTQKQAERLARSEESDMEQLAYYVEDRKANKILSIEEYPY